MLLTHGFGPVWWRGQGRPDLAWALGGCGGPGGQDSAGADSILSSNSMQGAGRMRRSPCGAEAGDAGERVDPGDVWEAGSSGEDDVRDVRRRRSQLHGDGAMGSCRGRDGEVRGIQRKQRKE